MDFFFFTCVRGGGGGGGQDKPAWTACPLRVKITSVGGKISRDSLPPRGQANHGWLAPWVSCLVGGGGGGLAVQGAR